MDNTIQIVSVFFTVCLIKKSRMHTNLMKVKCCLQSTIAIATHHQSTHETAATSLVWYMGNTVGHCNRAS